MDDTKIGKLNLTMSYQWYNRNAGFTFEEETYSDPVKRTELLRECSRYLYDRFGEVGLGSADPEPNPVASLSYGDRFMSVLFGCGIRYFKDQAPCVEAKTANPAEMMSLMIHGFEHNPTVRKMISDAKTLRKKYGAVYGHINTGSPLNVAVSLFGQDFLAACGAVPEAARHVLDVIGETIFRLDREICPLIEPGTYPIWPKSSGYGNCPAVMISPEMYRRVVLPSDIHYRSQVGEFHLHHCGVIDNYLDIYKELNPTTLDVGGGSDYGKLREAFPETSCSLLINTGQIESLSSNEIDDFVGDMVERASPADRISWISCVELSADVSDDTVKALATVHERI